MSNATAPGYPTGSGFATGSGYPYPTGFATGTGYVYPTGYANPTALAVPTVTGTPAFYRHGGLDEQQMLRRLPPRFRHR